MRSVPEAVERTRAGDVRAGEARIAHGSPAAMFLLMALHESAALALPLAAGQAVGRLLARDWDGFLVWALLMIALPLVEGLLLWAWEWTQGCGAEEAGTALQRGVLARMLSTSVGWFVPRQTGVLVTRATQDIRYLVDHDRVRWQAVRSVFALAVICVVLAQYHPLLTLAALLAAVPQLVRLRWAAHDARRVAADVVAGTETVNEYLRERLDFLRFTRSSGAGAWEHHQYDRLLRRTVGPAREARARLDARTAAVSGGLQTFGTLTLMASGSWLAARGAIGADGFVVAFGYLARIGVAAADWTAWFRRAAQAGQRRTRIAEIMAAPPEPAGSGTPPSRVDHIEIHDLTFHHPGRPEVLSGISCTLRRGEVTALVGASGSGKSTLCDLLSALTRPASGRILVNGDTDLADLGPQRWRSRVVYVAQFPYFFTGPLDDNLHLADVADADIARFVRVLGLEGVIERIRRQPGEELVPGKLSGGQRQRLGLLRGAARAAADRPVLAVFDEPTSAVDSLTEQQAMRVVTELRDVTPVLLVAHRMSTVRHADRVLVLDNGQIVEDGPPDELAARGGAFARLRAQEETAT
ncbi:ABC transporter ATP-binding protein [Streptomyces adelaidensis]|uniref:ABC transporter ATP-binding protein n=1 Tax=Streptomyces adelaidensis TaxID=2796465 RepID=UPI0019052191|nr:ABC transporter ATP-binding protein [Streptomyces adelaidensis]